MFLRVRRYTQQQIAIQQVSIRVDAVLNFQMTMTMTLTIQWKKDGLLCFSWIKAQIIARSQAPRHTLTGVTHSRPFWYSSRIESFNPVGKSSFVSRTSFDASSTHTTSQQNETQLKHCCFHAIETVNLKSRWIQPPGCSPPPYNTVYSMDVRWSITQAKLTQALLFCPC